MVKMVRRALFWFWPQLDSFHAATIEVARGQLSMIEQLREHVIILDEELHNIKNRLAGMHGPNPLTDPSIAEDADLWMEARKCQARLDVLTRELGGMRRSEIEAEPSRIQPE
jgi:hypothetical protein